MFNLISWVFGLVSLIIVIPATIPLLGWGNWFALPVIVMGVIFGALSSSDSGMKFCLIVLLVSAIRLAIGGGFI